MQHDFDLNVNNLNFTVNKVTANKRAIDELTRVKVKPCMVVETGATRLRNNIAELRRKIDQARIITSSIPVYTISNLLLMLLTKYFFSIVKYDVAYTITLK